MEDQYNVDDLNWSENEFLTFIMLYAANMDAEYSDEEKSMIQKLLNKERYVNVRDVFRSLNDVQCINLITSFKGLYFPTNARTEEMLSKLDSLFESDGDYSRVESACRSMLTRLL